MGVAVQHLALATGFFVAGAATGFPNPPVLGVAAVVSLVVGLLFTAVGAPKYLEGARGIAVAKNPPPARLSLAPTGLALRF
jgi:hypothetical protein